MFSKLFFIFLSLLLSFSSLQARQNSQQKVALAQNQEYTKTIRTFMAESKNLKNLVYKSAIYIAFPSIGKGGLIFGGAHGEGRVFRRGLWIGDITMSQYTIGLQVGGQTYSEMIFFKTEDAFKVFIKSGLISGTQSSIVGGSAGASGDINIDSDVLVFTMGNGGAMLEAATGVQAFTYTPKIHK
jgi:lipid-binding SYLF domain-containing protein